MKNCARRISGASKRLTNRENRCIASLAVWPFGDAQFQFFGIATAYTRWWNWSETCLWPHISQPERHSYTERKYLFKLVVHVHGFSDSLVLFNLVCIEVDVLIFHLSFDNCERTNKILYSIAFIPLKSQQPCYFLPNKITAHVEARYSARAEVPFRLHGSFSDFQSELNCAPSWIPLRVIDNLILRPRPN